MAFNHDYDLCYLRLDIYRKSYPPPATRKNKILITLIITASTLAFIYSLNETLYWLSGSPYFWCTSLLLLSIVSVKKAFDGSKIAFWLSEILCILNGTLLEQPCLFQGIFAFIAMIYFAFKRERKRALICGTFWLTSIAAFLVIYFAPGTQSRMLVTYYITTLSLGRRLINATVIALSHGTFTIIKFFVKPLVYVFLLFMPLIAKKIPASNIKLKIWQIIFITALFAPLMQFLEGFAVGMGFQDRAISLTLWYMLFVWCALFTFCYRGRLTTSEKFADFSRKYRYPMLILALLISYNFVNGVKFLQIGPKYLSEQRTRLQSIYDQKAAGNENVVLTMIKDIPALTMPNPSTFLSMTWLADYYGFKNVLLIPEELSGDVAAINEIRNGNYKSIAEVIDTNVSLVELLAFHSDPMLQPDIKTSGGLEISYKEAERWHRLGAANGNVQSMRSLSRLIYTQDKSLNGILRALYWLTRSQIAKLRL